MIRKCPECGSKNITITYYNNIEEHKLKRKIECRDCGFETEE